MAEDRCLAVEVWPGRNWLGCWAGGLEPVAADWLPPELGLDVPDGVAWPRGSAP